MKKTPLMKQYCDLKDNYNDCILFFRVGDFYEMFFEDAKRASHALNIALTAHGKNVDVPMCGIPYHASDAYIGKLIDKGHKIALCEQTESVYDRTDKKAPLKREVVRVITAGTLTESSMLDPKSYNFLLCCSPMKNGLISYSIVDLSIGDFFVDSTPMNDLNNVFSKWNPRECLVPESILNHDDLWRSINDWHTKIQLVPDVKYDLNQNRLNLKKIYKIAHLESFGSISDLEVRASGFLAQYLMYTQKSENIELKPIVKINDSHLMHLDKFTRDNLEITRTLQGNITGTLFDTLDNTVTAGGARLLKFRLTSPLKDLDLIKNRLNSIEFFIDNSIMIQEIKKYLALCDDLDRALGRVILDRSCPADCIKIANSLVAARNIYNLIIGFDLPTEIKDGIDALGYNETIIQKIKATIVECPPLKINEGDFIKDGYSGSLDELRNIKSVCDDKVKEMQDVYKQETEIPTLRIKYNNVLGYCVEIPNSQKKKMLYSFIEKQSLSTITRYSNSHLQEISARMLNAKALAVEKEVQIFNDLVDFIKSVKKSILYVAKVIAIIDVNVALANKSIINKYCKPTIDNGNNFNISNGRNPIVENILQKHNETFTANDCQLIDKKCLLMTGPNMAGKSTYLRQNALIALMAQAGCYVAADSMNFGMIDGIFVRIGASDNLANGMSTFMMEMVEVACILNNATENSLIIVDEVGRGTSAQEGKAIALAIMEHISIRKIRSLFATHYHELVKLSEHDQNIFCMTMSISEKDGNLLFMHKIKSGFTDQSFAISVCKMAGIPNSVIERSRKILEDDNKDKRSRIA
ncbi:DNA mismatch repair protein MutS [Candidatus Cytomitobacter primus]|uniref:DNA mismatch repair protein MutS n=1 Tax=Candidatus Cytomitobacter primus TaxID=2066024 RepID=A0A5C0UF62_9PROT|nr:DNA mismatch repair protein MutS [Candidatus Cytomitobacter primus]QEK38321.1 DNA mismatch repair protein MutS [Candidatus Cytomitobacter primus]